MANKLPPLDPREALNRIRMEIELAESMGKPVDYHEVVVNIKEALREAGIKVKQGPR
jgi:hypothetical protein